MDEQGKPIRRALAAFLVSCEDEPQRRYWPLLLGRNEVARTEDSSRADVQIPHGSISNHHAHVDCDPGGVVVRDLGSTNHVFHNDKPVGFLWHVQVHDGDTVRFGSYTVRYLALRCVQGHLVLPGALSCNEGGHELDENPLGYRGIIAR
jgi:pSer/pThr/pTyr-binding forkhead associated (FHA) protein